MFERISLRHQTEIPESPIDIGFLLESMIFYGKVSVVADHSILKQLIAVFGFEILNDLLDSEALEILYTETRTGIASGSNKDRLAVYGPVIFSSPQHTLHLDLIKFCKEIAKKEGKGRRNALRLEKKISISNHDNSIATGGRQILLDSDFVEYSVLELIKQYIPQIDKLPTDATFKTEEVEGGISVRTNLNFDTLNTLYQKNVSPKYSTLSPPYLLAKVYDVECDLYFASRQLSEIATSEINSKLIAKRFSHLADRCEKSRRHQDSFQDFIFNGSKTIRQSYNRGEIPLLEIVKVILKASDFKNWLQKKDIDTNLLSEYYMEVTKESFIDKLPGKSIRWMVFTGIGLGLDAIGTGGIGTLSGIGLGAFDTFFVDKLLRGWRPNQFVEDNLKILIK